MYRTFLYSGAIVLAINGAPGSAAGATIQVFGQTGPVEANRSARAPRVGGRAPAVPHFADRFADMPSASHPATHGTPVVAPGARVRVTTALGAPELLVFNVGDLNGDGIVCRKRVLSFGPNVIIIIDNTFPDGPDDGDGLDCPEGVDEVAVAGRF